MQCQRCNGMMISERFYGPGNPFWGWRCVRCGEIFDPIILENRSIVQSWRWSGTREPPKGIKERKGNVRVSKEARKIYTPHVHQVPP